MISDELLERGADLIRRGRLVAFPTETVYGLGANALDPAAVARIYEVKGRPATSPLIVHAASREMARGLAAVWPESAEALAREFWPGPLTLVLEKDRRIPDIVTAGLQTVGIRVPAHPVALALIRAAGVPVAAPSANRFTQLSPTTADHVRAGLGDAVDLILDGGPCEVGIESTVLSLAGGRAAILRPGMVSQAEIEAVIGEVEVAAGAGPGAHPSPGMHHRHYSPRTPLFVLPADAAPPDGRGAWVRFAESGTGATAESVPMPREPEAYASQLYDTLHRLDAGGYAWIAVEAPPDTPEWAGIRDRLRRAAQHL